MKKKAVHPAESSSTMSKAEVCKFLGKSKRTVEGYVASERLPVKYFKGPNGMTAIFERADVEAFQAAESEVWDSSKRPTSTGIALVPAAVKEIAPSMASLAESLAALARFAQENNARYAPQAVYVSLKDACALTGLSAATVKAANVKTMPFGNGVRYRRADLEQL